jgi:hypothetical protein
MASTMAVSWTSSSDPSVHRTRASAHRISMPCMASMLGMKDGAAVAGACHSPAANVQSKHLEDSNGGDTLLVDIRPTVSSTLWKGLSQPMWLPPNSGAAAPRPSCRHLPQRADRRSRLLDASGPHRMIAGGRATGRAAPVARGRGPMVGRFAPTEGVKKSWVTLHDAPRHPAHPGAVLSGVSSMQRSATSCSLMIANLAL